VNDWLNDWLTKSWTVAGSSTVGRDDYWWSEPANCWRPAGNSSSSKHNWLQSSQLADWCHHINCSLTAVCSACEPCCYCAPVWMQMMWVCFSARISQEPYIRTLPNFLWLLSVAMARSFTHGIVTHCVLPLLRMVSVFPIMAAWHYSSSLVAMCAWLNTNAALYWLCPVLVDVGRKD